MSQYKVGQKVIRKYEHRDRNKDDDDYWIATITAVKRYGLYSVEGPSVPEDWGEWNWNSAFFERVPTKLEKALR